MGYVKPNALAPRKFRLGDVASRRGPRRAPWGCFASDDHVFGVGVFLWFKTREDLLLFLAEYEGADSEQHDQTLLRAEMRKAAKQVLSGRLGFEKGRVRFNGILKGHLQIEWLGHFAEMLSGKHPFGRKLRAGFLGVEDAPASSSIPPNVVKDFIEDLRNYGH